MTMTRSRVYSIFLLTLAIVAATVQPAAAATGNSGYWKKFTEYWFGLFQKQNGVALIVVLAGLVSLFIITRGKWQK
ncbi:MAG: hypothetical protein ACRCZF_27810 [Gemmataceae bacterium]